jgi:predicted nucleic acid-binding protein
MKLSVLLDTSFFIRLLNDEDQLHENAKGYYKYFLEQGIVLKVSTISIAEYCVMGKITELPLRNIQIVSFNVDHAKRTGELAKVIFEHNKIEIEKLTPRAIIPNDSKLFAQADLDDAVSYFVTSDTRSKNTFSALKQKVLPKFELIDVSTPFTESFGVLF